MNKFKVKKISKCTEAITLSTKGSRDNEIHDTEDNIFYNDIYVLEFKDIAKRIIEFLREYPFYRRLHNTRMKYALSEKDLKNNHNILVLQQLSGKNLLFIVRDRLRKLPYHETFRSKQKLKEINGREVSGALHIDLRLTYIHKVINEVKLLLKDITFNKKELQTNEKTLGLIETSKTSLLGTSKTKYIK